MRISDWSSDVCSSDLCYISREGTTTREPRTGDDRTGGSTSIDKSLCLRLSNPFTDIDLSLMGTPDDILGRSSVLVDDWGRSEERSVWHECVGTGRSRWSPSN